MNPTVLILHVSGTNRDTEAARACELAGARPEIVHLNQLRGGERRFGDYDLLLLPGGFSYGDALGAGARWALDLQVFFHDQIHAFVESGRPVLGICNGFQVLVKAGLLPGETGGARSMAQGALAEIAHRRVTLTENASGRFECRWVHLIANRGGKASFLAALGEPIFCPVAHGEGRFAVRDAETLRELEEKGLVAFRYADADGRLADGRYPLNPNGSAGDIAGLCSERGNVVGLMPHPEDHLVPLQNPLGRQAPGGRLGLRIFEALIAGMKN